MGTEKLGALGAARQHILITTGFSKFAPGSHSLPGLN